MFGSSAHILSNDMVSYYRTMFNLPAAPAAACRLSTDDFLQATQSGFRHVHSTETAILHLLSDILQIYQQIADTYCSGSFGF